MSEPTVTHASMDVPEARLPAAPPLPLEPAGLTLPDSDGHQPLTLCGARITLRGDAGGGPRDVRAGTLGIASELRVRVAEGGDAAPVRVRRTALGVERTYRHHELRLIERSAVAHDRPVAFLEWSLDPDGPGDAATFAVDWRTDLRDVDAVAPSGSPEPRGKLLARARANVAIVSAAPAAARACFVLSRAPASWQLGEAESSSSRCGFRVRLERGESVRLAVIGARDDGELSSTLAAIADPGALLRTRATALRRLRRDRLSVDAPDEAIGAAVEWAKLRLDAHLAALVAGGAPIRDESVPPSGHDDAAATADAALAGLGALAAGDFKAAGDIIDLLRGRQHATGRIAHDTSLEAGATATALYALLCAGHLAWTADIQFLRERWPSVRRAIDHLRSCAAAPVAGAVPPLEGVLHEIAIAAESIGEAEDAAALRAGATIALGGKPARPRTGAEPAVLLRILGAGAAELAEGRSHEGFRLWRAQAAGGLDDARIMAVLVHGILGIEPDAPRHRLRLRPQLPTEWDRLRVTNLAMADAAVDLSCTRERDQHVVRVEQTRGAVPIRAVLELVVPGRVLRAATVDGAPADLDARRFGDRLLVPVQLTLDRSRALTLSVGR